MGMYRNYMNWREGVLDRARQKAADRRQRMELQRAEDRRWASQPSRASAMSSAPAAPTATITAKPVRYEYRTEKFRRASGRDVQRRLNHLGKQGWTVTGTTTESALEWASRYVVTLQRARR